MLILLAACGQAEEPPQVEPPAPIEPVEEFIPDEPVEILEAPEPFACAAIQNMTSSDPSKIGDNAVIAITVGADQFKKGVYDLGYLYPTGLFRIARRGIKNPAIVAIKLKGPGSVKSQPMDLTFTCDNQTFTVFLPEMHAQTVFYMDTYGRLYWRDEAHDGTGKTMSSFNAVVEEHRYNQ